MRGGTVGHLKHVCLGSLTLLGVVVRLFVFVCGPACIGYEKSLRYFYLFLFFAHSLHLVLLFNAAIEGFRCTPWLRVYFTVSHY